tara:strand:- start:11821 stop:12195 length:375 start_codon:yes stop_codon:yes gene_type:complete
MSVFNLASFGVRFGKRGIKKILEIHKKSQQNRYIKKNFDKGSETEKASMTNKFLKNETDLKKLTKDKEVKKTINALDKRNKRGKKEPGSYIQKKLKAEETSKFKKGKFVQVKTKLGRNRPTKLY